MSLFFNMLSRFVIAFLTRRKYLLISWLWSPSAVILKPKKIVSVTAFTQFLTGWNGDLHITVGFPSDSALKNLRPM